jgi:hypothetical protein
MGILMRYLSPPYWLMRFILWTAPQRSVHGVRVTVTSTTPQVVDGVCEKVGAAFDLLQAAHPRSYRAVRRELGRIVVWPEPRRLGTWYGPLRVCTFSLSHLTRDESSAYIARVLVHEAMHGRLERKGYRYTKARRLRLERLCGQAALAFAERLEDGGASRREAIEWLGQLNQLYSDESLRAGSLESLRGLGTPEWLVRAVDRLHRWRAA